MTNNRAGELGFHSGSGSGNGDAGRMRAEGANQELKLIGGFQAPRYPYPYGLNRMDCGMGGCMGSVRVKGGTCDTS